MVITAEIADMRIGMMLISMAEFIAMVVTVGITIRLIEMDVIIIGKILILHSFKSTMPSNFAPTRKSSSNSFFGFEDFFAP